VPPGLVSSKRERAASFPKEVGKPENLLAFLLALNMRTDFLKIILIFCCYYVAYFFLFSIFMLAKNP
jgi:hypothetical protein